MNTATTLLNDVVVTAAAQNGGGAASVDLNAITANEVILEATVTNGASSPGAGKYLDIYYAFGTVATAEGIPAVLGPSAGVFRVRLDQTPSAVRVFTSDVLLKKARYAHVWYSHEAFDAAVNLTLKLVS